MENESSIENIPQAAAVPIAKEGTSDPQGITLLAEEALQPPPTSPEEVMQTGLQTGPSAIKVDHVTRVYHVGASEVYALRDISLDIPKGIFAGMRGRSGSGKTTLLNLIGGLDRATQGEVHLFGHPISAMSNDQLTDIRRHRIGFVFQSFAIIPTFSAVENVELMLRIAGVVTDRRKRALRTLEIVGLASRANHRPWELSGGQQQRVAIARALSTHPDLILADEPTGELDSTTGHQIMALFRYIVEHEGITVVMSTHDPMIEDYAQVVYELSDGQVKDIRHRQG